MTEISIIGNNISGLGALNVGETLETQYATLREKCLEQYGPDFCNAVMPRNMIYALTRRGEGYALPWWAWMIIGVFAGRILK